MQSIINRCTGKTFTSFYKSFCGPTRSINVNYVYIVSGLGVRCKSCPGVPKMEDCSHIVTCGDNEVQLLNYTVVLTPFQRYSNENITLVEQEEQTLPEHMNPIEKS